MLESSWLFCSLCCCPALFWQTYWRNASSIRTEVATEICFFGIFLVDYVLNIIGAPRKLEYLFGSQGLVDALSLLPGVSAIIAILASSLATSSGFLRFFRIAKTIRVLRLIRVLTLGSRGNEHEVAVQIAKLFISIASVFFISTSVVFEIDEGLQGSFNSSLDSFHTALYYIVVTCTTLGYGDFYPTKTLTRLLVMVIIFVAFTLIPYQLSNLAAAMARRPKYSKELQLDRFTDHIIICGARPSASLASFCEEIFHPNHSLTDFDRKLVAVIVSPHQPSRQQKALLERPLFSGRLSWLVGSITSPVALSKVHAEKAKAIFIFQTQGFTDCAEAEDDIMIKTISTLRYVTRKLPPPPSATHSQNSSPSTYNRPIVVVETLSVKSRDTLHRAGADIVMCHDEFKYAVLAYGALFPGFISLFLNLVKSDPYKLDEIPKDTWMYDYASGAEYEVYTVELDRENLHESVKAASFIQVAVALYEFSKGKVVLLGVEKKGQVSINPQDLMGTCDNAFMFALTIQDALAAMSGLRLSKSLIKSCSSEFLGNQSQETLGDLKCDEETKSSCNSDEPEFSSPNEHYIPKSVSIVNQPSYHSEKDLMLNYLYPINYLTSSRGDIQSPRAGIPNALEDHLVLCVCNSKYGDRLQTVLNFLGPVKLRSKDDVVLLYEHADEVKQRMETEGLDTSRVHFVTGNPKDEVFLNQCQIRCARAVVVMGERSQHISGVNNIVHPDRHTVICTLKIQDILDEQPEELGPQILHKTFIITELTQDSSVYYLKQHADDLTHAKATRETERDHYHTTRLGVKVPVLLRYSVSSSSATMIYDWPAFAQGRVLTQSLLDAFLVQCMFNKSTLAFWEALLQAGRRGMSSRKPSKLSNRSFSWDQGNRGKLDKIELPPAFAGKRYGELAVRLMTHDKKVPIALYRCHRAKKAPQRNDVEEGDGAVVWETSITYTHVNPDYETLLHAKDEVFVI